MAKYTSGRQKNLKVGISSYSENLTSLEVIGKVGIGTTNATSNLYVVGDGYFTGIITANRIISSIYGEFTGGSVSGTSIVGTALSIVGISTLGTVKVSSGIITATTGVVTYYGDGSKLSGITASSIVGVTSYATSSGIATYATNAGIATYATNAGIATYASRAGIATYATTSGVSTNVIGGIASVTSLSVSGITTLGVVTAGNIYSTGIITATSINFASGGVLGDLYSDGGIGIGLKASPANYYAVVASNNLQQFLQVDDTQIFITTGYASITGTYDWKFNKNGALTFPDNTIQYTAFTGYASTAGIATYATSAGIATYATNAGIATYATSAGISTYATSAGIATYATSAGIATYATNAGIATYATSSGIATYATSSGIATYANSSGIATYATSAGVSTIAGYASTAGIATALQNARNFSITGNFVTATAISFDGTGNVALAATITADSIGLGTYTSGDYVKSISGTSNQITVSATSGEGSTPTLSLPSNLILPQDATVTRDLQVNRNLNVTGNITLGGTTAFLNVQQLKISDSDIVIGVRTDAFGNDVSNDTTANHGGIAVASTEGSPLVNLNIAGIETLAPTYKKIMWFKSGTFAGLGTDAWLINYAVGIGSTQFPTGTRLAAGSVQFTENDLAVVRNINSSGVITATTFYGTLSGYATNAGIATYATNAGIATYATSSGIATYATSAGIATYATSAGIATYATNAGIATYATNSGIATNLGGGSPGVIPYQSNTGITLFTQVGTAGSILVSNGTGIPYWGNITAGGGIAGITIRDEGTQLATNISSLDFVGPNISATTSGVAATITVADYVSRSGIATYSPNAGIATNVIGGISSVTQLSVSGISTLGTVEISSGIVTATSGVVTYYGDGSKLSGINASGSVSISTNTTNQAQYLTYVTGTGSTTGFGVSLTGLVFNPFRENLGIGTTNPTSKLWVNGDGYFVGVVSASNFYVGGNIIGGGSVSSASLVGTALSVSGISTFSNGPVLIGTGTSTGTVDQDLQVIGSAYISGGLGVGVTNNTTAGNIVVSGTVTANSDARLKTNVKTIDNALEKVLSLRGVEYDRIDTGDHQIGLIAQEVEKIIPQVVYPKQPAPDYETKSVSYQNIVGLLIEAIKEQDKRILELERKLGEN